MVVGRVVVPFDRPLDWKYMGSSAFVVRMRGRLGYVGCFDFAASKKRVGDFSSQDGKYLELVHGLAWRTLVQHSLALAQNQDIGRQQDSQ